MSSLFYSLKNPHISKKNYFCKLKITFTICKNIFKEILKIL